jgi:hypothetical protein
MQTLVVYLAGQCMVCAATFVALTSFSLGIYPLPVWVWAIAGGIAAYVYAATIGKRILEEGAEQ